MLLFLIVTILAQHPFNFLQGEAPAPKEAQVAEDEEEEDEDFIIIPDESISEEKESQ